MFVPGEADQQRKDVRNRVEICTRQKSDVTVQLDGTGQVARVVVTGPYAQQVRACVLKALKGLTFACLPSYHHHRTPRPVYPPGVIME